MFLGSDQNGVVGICQHLCVIFAIAQSHDLEVFAVDSPHLVH